MHGLRSLTPASAPPSFNFPNYHGDERQPMDLMRKAASVFEKRNARPAFGS
jgi:hypothetical protein